MSSCTHWSEVQMDSILACGLIGKSAFEWWPVSFPLFQIPPCISLFKHPHSGITGTSEAKPLRVGGFPVSTLPNPTVHCSDCWTLSPIANHLFHILWCAGESELDFMDISSSFSLLGGDIDSHITHIEHPNRFEDRVRLNLQSCYWWANFAKHTMNQ